MMSEAKANPVADLDPVPDAWIVNGCPTSIDFWQMCLPLPPVPLEQESAMAAASGKWCGVLTICCIGWIGLIRCIPADRVEKFRSF
jgi:hypothetical protein